MVAMLVDRLVRKKAGLMVGWKAGMTVEKWAAKMVGTTVELMVA